MADTKIHKSETETETEMEIDKVEKVEEKVEEKEGSGSVDFAELRDDLFREAAKLVSDVPSTKIAIFVAPPLSSQSDVSMYTFGYPSVNGVVNTFNCPDPAPPVDAEEHAEDEEDEDEDEDEDDEEDDAEDEDEPSQKFWWEDAKQFESMNPEELDAAHERLARLRDRMSLELDAKLRSQASGNHKDLPNDKDEPKP